MLRPDVLNEIMRELASSFPTDHMRIALRALIDSDERPEYKTYGKN